MTGAVDSVRRYARLLDTALPDGSFVVGTSYLQGHSVIVRLRHLTSDCQTAATSGVNLRAGYGGIDTIAATGDGKILLGGGIGHHALVGRFFANGGLDTSFGTNGWVRLVPRERPIRGMGRPSFAVTSIAVAPSGMIVLGGNDGGAHCCSREFVGELTADGAPVTGFGHGGSRIIPGIAGSYTTDVSVNPDQSVNALGEYEQSGCGGPYIVRIRPDGLLDGGFDKAIARTIRTITRPDSRFTPSLVPDGSGGFTLVGGFDRTCVVPARHLPSRGVSLRIDASGSLVGDLTHFPSPLYAFDTPAALRLPSGGVVAAAVQYSRSYRAKALLVQAFAPDGSRDSGVGNDGQLHFPIPAGQGANFPTADLLLDANGSSWLVAGFPHEIELIPVSLN